MKKSIAPQPFVGAMPVVIVATKDEEKVNFATHGMFGQLCYDPPLIYISVVKKHLTAKNISKTKRFSVNIPSAELMDKVKYCGGVSGAEEDKSQAFEVFYGSSEVPMICKCPVNMSCEVQDTIDTKDMVVFIGRVVEAFSEEACNVEDTPDITRMDPILCTIQGKFHKLGNEIK